VLDPFRPPAEPYGAGNRGLEYDTRPGDRVVASADGTVVFAGPVAGSLHVTVRHADGVRTSYSFLAAVGVALGQIVRQGDQIGVAGERLHFGAREGAAYFDPATLFGGGSFEVELVPFEVPPGSTPQSEAMALAGLVLDDHPSLAVPGIDDALGWLRDRAVSTAWYLDQADLPARGLGILADLGGRLVFPGPCSEGAPPPVPVEGDARVAITVAGLGSSSMSGSIDELRTAELGYAEERVARFSYAGGRTPQSGTALDGLLTTTYAPSDTDGDLRDAARRLADLVESVVAARRDTTVDVFAHSQGGVVARLALLELADRGFGFDRLGVVATLGSPHRGADVATAVSAAGTSPAGNLGIDVAASLLGTRVDPDARAVRQLAEHSDVVRELAERGVPPGVRLVSIAARGDLAVAAPNAEVAGATNVIVPVAGWSAHHELVASEAATGELARALAGQPPACEDWRDVVADVATGHAISILHDHIGAAALASLP
jgi:murein DD-endopeptidase MepM/ murein hydrolase activator NlpD